MYRSQELEEHYHLDAMSTLLSEDTSQAFFYFFLLLLGFVQAALPQTETEDLKDQETSLESVMYLFFAHCESALLDNLMKIFIASG